MKHWSGLLGLVLAFSLALAGRAQITSGTISGTVKDSSGAVLPGAKVVVLNEETGISRTATADMAGRYAAPALGLGRYRVTASLEGFQTQVRSGIEITVSREAIVNFDLPVGAITQSVEVTGEAPLVDTVKGGMGSVLEATAISELPLNGRDIAQLITIQTGAMQYTGTTRTGEGGKQIVVSGSRPTTNVFLMDGIAIESYNTKTPTGTSGNFLGVEAVREFRVESNAYSAEFGRGSGGQFNIATKSGTNAFHGSLFEFLRNDNLDAARWEDNAFERGKPEFKRNQFGGSIGGPILRDRSFFFGTYEGYRERLGATIVSQTFTAEQRQGILRNAAGQPQAPIAIDDRVRPYLNLWPAPNIPQLLLDGTGQYAFSFSQPTDEDFFQIRVDHKLSDNDSIFARHTFLHSRQQLPGTFPQFFLHERARNQYTTIEESHIFSPRFLNTLRAGFTRTSPVESAAEEPAVDRSLYFVPEIPQMGSISVSGVSGIGNGITIDGRTVNSFQWIDDARYTQGRHSLKFGLQWDRIQFNGNNPARDAGDYSFNSYADFFAARVNRFRGSIAVGFNDPTRSMRENIAGLYFQDDFQVLPRLTLNLGVRYEFITVPKENHGRVGNLRGDLAFIQRATVSDLTLGNPWFDNPSRKNFAPRFGFAWDVFGNSKMAVRGGFGIFHLQFNQSWIRTTAFRMPPFLVEQQASSTATQQVPFPNIYQLCGRDNPFNPRDPRCVGRPAPDMVPFHMRTPYMMQYNLNIQRQLMANTVVTIGYVGSRGVSLPAAGDLNQAVAQIVNGRLAYDTTRQTRPNPNFDDIRYRYPVASSFYNSLQMSFKRSFTQGFQFGSSYTFSKTIDDNSGNQTAGDTDAGPNWIFYYYDKSLNRGLANFDARHAFTFNSTYELPLGPGKMFGSGLTGVAKAALSGWQVGGIMSLISGLPATVQIANRLTALGIHNEVADLAPGASNNPTRPGNPNEYIDRAAFLFPPNLPTARTLGNVGRNTVTQPGLATVDFTVTKSTAITEASRLQFRFEAFNLFNRVNFGIPAMQAFDNRGNPTGSFGTITTTKTTARQLQFGLRYIF